MIKVVWHVIICLLQLHAHNVGHCVLIINLLLHFSKSLCLHLYTLRSVVWNSLVKINTCFKYLLCGLAHSSVALISLIWKTEIKAHDWLGLLQRLSFLRVWTVTYCWEFAKSVMVLKEVLNFANNGWIFFLEGDYCRFSLSSSVSVLNARANLEIRSKMPYKLTRRWGQSFPAIHIINYNAAFTGCFFLTGI